MKKIFFLLFILIGSISQAQVTVVGYISTQGVANYPTHIDSMGKGGYMVAANTTERNAIPCLRRKYGMAVYVQNLQKLYILKDSNCVNTWIEFSGGGGGSADLQTVLNNGHFLDSERNTQGTDAGIGISNKNINAFGYQAAANSSGGNVNAFGFKAAGGSATNNGYNINALGQYSAEYNTGFNVNALGASSTAENIGNDVNAMGFLSAYKNEGSNVNAFGYQALDSNLGSNVNAFGYSSARNNTGTNVSSFGYRAGENNNNNNVVLFGAYATANEPDQLVLVNSNPNNIRISYGCSEKSDITITIPDKSAYFMTANLPKVINASDSNEAFLDYADNYRVINSGPDKANEMTLHFPDPEKNCQVGGQRMVVSNVINPSIGGGNVILDSTYKIFYGGTDVQISTIPPGQTIEFYADSVFWRSISSDVKPVYGVIDLNSSNPTSNYYMVNSGIYKFYSNFWGYSLYFPDASLMKGASLTIITENSNISLGGTNVIDPITGTSIGSLYGNGASTYISDGTNWYQITERH